MPTKNLVVITPCTPMPCLLKASRNYGQLLSRNFLAREGVAVRDTFDSCDTCAPRAQCFAFSSKLTYLCSFCVFAVSIAHKTIVR